MRYAAISCVLVGVVAGATGCGWQGASSPAPQGGLAVVDLDEVAKSLGADTRLNDMIRMRKVSLNNALGKIKTDLQDELKTELDDVKAQFGNEIPAEKAKEIREKTLKANATVQQALTQATTDLNLYAEQLKQRFRTEVRPIAQEIAAKKGFSIVIPKNDGLLLSVSPANDITNDVILAMQDRNRKALAEAKPASDAKPTTEARPADEAPAKPKKKTDDKASREKARPNEGTGQ
jgi:Skp family chaperone for outer membrane proteins